MRNLSKLEEARMSLAQAITRSLDAETPHTPDGRAVEEHVYAGELRLRRGGREDLGFRLSEVLDEDVTESAARKEIREVISKIDAELDPSIDVERDFRTASDGGRR